MRTFFIFALSFAVSAASLMGCSGTTTGTGTSSGGTANNDDATEPFDAEVFCTKAVEECRDPSLTRAKCLSTFELVRVGSDCNASLAGATCADLASPTSEVMKTCFPPCSGGPSCNGTETITTCTTNGMSITVECEGVCEAAGRPYSGICGTSAQGASSPDGKAKCWCQ